MKVHHVLIAMSLFFLATISQCRADDADTELLNQTTALLARHDAAFAAQDVKGIMATYVSGPQIFLMGTGPGEMYRGSEGIEAAYNQFFTKFDKGTAGFTYHWITVGSKADMAWFAAEYTLKGKVQGKDSEVGLNLSGTLQKENGRWSILAMHFSRLGVMDEPGETRSK